MALQLFKKPEEPTANLGASEIDRLKASIKRKLGVDVDAKDPVNEDAELRKRYEEMDAENRKAARLEREEERRLDYEAARDLIKNGTLVVTLDGRRQAAPDLSCGCGEPLQDARDVLAEFGGTMLRMGGRDFFDGYSSGWTTVPAYNDMEKCPKCGAKTRLFAQLVLEV